MTTNPITLRKSTTEEKLFKILERLLNYYEQELWDYWLKLKRFIESFPSNKEEEKETLKNVKEYDEKLLSLIRKEVKWVDVRDVLSFCPYEVKISRYQLKQMIIGSIEVFNRDVVSNWINFLVANGYLKQNPDSYIMKKSFNGVQTIETIMPTNDTRYFVIPFKTAYTLFKDNDPQRETGQTKPQQPKQQTNLTLYESRSPNDQAEIKDNSSVNPLKSP